MDGQEDTCPGNSHSEVTQSGESHHYGPPLSLQTLRIAHTHWWGRGGTGEWKKGLGMGGQHMKTVLDLHPFIWLCLLAPGVFQAPTQVLFRGLSFHSFGLLSALSQLL